jgi:hypothetical protein
MPSGGPGGMGPGASEVEYADFVGVTTDGKVVEDLYSVHSTGVSTDAVVKAAQAFLDGPSATQRRATLFDVQADEWLAWSNVDGYEREGVRMGDLSEKQRDLGYALLGAALSADGLTQTRNIMKLNALTSGSPTRDCPDPVSRAWAARAGRRRSSTSTPSSARPTGATTGWTC